MHQICITCGDSSPDAETRFTLIGEHGWRPLSLSDGDQVEWRCPECWDQYKQTATSRPPPSQVILAHAALDDAADDRTKKTE